MNHDIVVLNWINVAEKTPVDRFQALADFSKLPKRVHGDSITWCDRFFVDAANPYAPDNKAKHSYHVAGRVGFDLVRHEYSFKGTPLVVVEGVNFVAVTAKPPKFDATAPSTWAAAIDALAQQVLKPSASKQSWKFQYPQKPAEGMVISTNSPLDPFEMSDWRDRADVVVRNGAIHFLLYKKRPELADFLHDGQWFDDDFRKPKP